MKCEREYLIQQPLALLILLSAQLVLTAAAFGNNPAANLIKVGQSGGSKREYRLGVLAPAIVRKEGNEFSGLNLNATLVALQMSIEKWLPSILPDYYFSLVYQDTECDFQKHSMSPVYLYSDFNVHGFFGPMCVTIVSWTTQVAKLHDLPVMTVGSPSKANIKGVIPLLPPFNFDGSSSQQEHHPDLFYTINQTFAHFDWAFSLAAVYVKDDSRDDVFMQAIWSFVWSWRNAAVESIDAYQVALISDKYENGTVYLKHLDLKGVGFRSWTRVLVISMHPRLFRDFMWNLFHHLKLPIEEYAILFLDVHYPMNSEDWLQPWRDRNLPLEHEKNKLMKHFFRHVLIYRPQAVLTDEDTLHAISRSYNEACEASEFPFCQLPNTPEQMQFVSATSDGIKLFMQAMNKSIEQGRDLKKDPFLMADFVDYIAGKTFLKENNFTSTAKFNDRGERVSKIHLWRMLDTETGNFSIHVIFNEDGTNKTFSPGVNWISGSAPKNPPICGYDNDKCKKPETLKYLVTFVSLGVSIFLIIMLILGFIIYRKVKLEEELMKMIWKIKHDELDFTEWKSSFTPSLGHHVVNSLDSKAQSNPLQNHGKTVLANSSIITSSVKEMLNSSNNNNLSVNGTVSNGNGGKLSVVIPSRKTSSSIFAVRRTSNNQGPMALSHKERMSVVAGTPYEHVFTSNRPEPQYVFPRYKKMKVAARPLKDSVQFELNRKRLIELKNLKTFTSEHVVRFIGCTVDQPRYIVYENCAKGSLYHFLRSPMKADLSFRFSLMLDIAKGLLFLVQNGMFHGRLNAKTCVLDNRFVCKIGDHGLYSLRPLPIIDLSQPDLNTEDKYYVKYVYVAPEILRRDTLPSSQEMQHSEFTHLMQRADYYSLAIICHEILYQKQPFHITNRDYTHRQKIVEVIKGGKSPFRPMFDDRDFKEELETYENDVQEAMRLRLNTARHVIEQCWTENPHDRPDMNWVCSRLKENVPENIMENMLQRMDKYAKTMETLVEEKAKHVVLEKKRADDLLYSILPVAIATKLIRNEKVESEWFDEATIYFSDIVGFTALSSSSSPNQVVDLLNNLYTLFDNIIDEFDVYKVETIGDAYMVVSGIPIRNGATHSYNIAAMSLKLLEAVKNDFVIPHRPDEKLKLRIGLHTGPACAGVVGTKMPRYCLFGDTVNTASRMESNGEPLKIHISEQCRTSLVSFNEFMIDYRGEIEMKGKGIQKTYWLRGRKSDLLAKHPKLAGIIGSGGLAPSGRHSVCVLPGSLNLDTSEFPGTDLHGHSKGNGATLLNSAPAASEGPRHSHGECSTPVDLIHNSTLDDSVFGTTPTPNVNGKGGGGGAKQFFSYPKNKLKRQHSSEIAPNINSHPSSVNAAHLSQQEIASSNC